MRLHILGAGSLGLLWAGRLARQNHPVSLILRNQAALAAWQARGGMLEFKEGERLEQWAVDLQTADAAEPIDYLIVATKAYSALGAIESVMPRLRPEACILMLQNGLGAQEQAQARWPQSRFLFASVTDGAFTRGPGQVVWAGRGLTRIGSPEPGPAPAWLDDLTQGGIAWQWEPDIRAVLWHKLAINCAINPLSALHDCRNGEVAARSADRFGRLLDELDALLSAVGAPLPPGVLTSQVHDVIARTSANSSSMRQDISAGRRTEIDYLLGHACRVARERALSVPTLEGLLSELQALLRQRGLPLD